MMTRNGEAIFGEIVAFAVKDKHVLVAYEEFLVTSPLVALINSVTQVASTERDAVLRLLVHLELHTAHLFKRIVGRRPAIRELEGRLLPAALFELDNFTYVSPIVSSIY